MFAETSTFTGGGLSLNHSPPTVTRFPGFFFIDTDKRISLRAYPAGLPGSEDDNDVDSNECTIERVMACRCVGTHKATGQMLQLLQGLVRRVMDKLRAAGDIKRELSRLEGLHIKPSADAIFLTMSQIKVSRH